MSLWAPQIPMTVNTRLPLTPDTTNAELNEQLTPLYGALFMLQEGIDRVARYDYYFTAATTYGQLIGVWTNNSRAEARLANASTTPIFAVGICVMYNGVAAGATGTVQLKGIIPGLSGLTPGAIYYLSDTGNGNITTVKPVGAGKIVQIVGWALDTNNLWFDPQLAYTQL